MIYSSLESLGFLQVYKQFIGKKPNTSYKVTKEGRKAFNKHLDALEALLKNRKHFFHQKTVMNTITNITERSIIQIYFVFQSTLRYE